MLRKLQKKLVLMAKLYTIGADLRSSFSLLFQLLLLSVGRYIGLIARPFSCRVQASGKAATMYCTGTMGELLTIIDIFADKNYVQKYDLPAPVRAVLDLGANIGIATVWLSLTYPDAQVHAYEPNPKLYTLLQKNVAGLANVTTFEQAISGTEGTVTFNQSLHSLESSIFEARESTAITVPSVTLDQTIAAIGGSVDYMKIDIEGAEFDALKACTLLGQVRSVVGEAHTEQSRHTQHELIDLLASFNVIEIYNPNNDTVFGFRAARLISQ